MSPFKFNFDEDDFDESILNTIKRSKTEALAGNLSKKISEFMKNQRASNRYWIEDEFGMLQSSDEELDLDYFYNENSEMYLSYPYSVNEYTIYAKQICFSDEANECRFLYDGSKPYTYLSIDDAQDKENLIEGIEEWKKNYPTGDELKFLESMNDLLERFIRYVNASKSKKERRKYYHH